MSPVLRACTVCGRTCQHGNRCERHLKPRARTGSYTRAAARVRATGTHCWLCGRPFTVDDPTVADHAVPRMYGGTDDESNLRPAPTAGAVRDSLRAEKAKP
jgi:5-methylcytosine-specific restriction endonuclease McrA